MSEITKIWLPSAKETALAGTSLAASLYKLPLAILLHGELGAGKTTFLQGFANALGVDEAITSPTYALEQRYEAFSSQLSAHSFKFIHLDLYRLTEVKAKELVRSTDDHQGIRVIEWAERLGSDWRGGVDAWIDIHLEDAEDSDDADAADDVRSSASSDSLESNRENLHGRNLRVEFHDIPLPSREQVEEWREEVRLPKHIVAHCDAVADVCDRFSANFLERGILVRPLALRRCAEVHDLLRFIDFRMHRNPEHYPAAYAEEEQRNTNFWNEWKSHYAGLRHEAACAQFLRERGYAELGQIVAPHGLVQPKPDRDTIEQKLLFYADKRVKLDQFVTLDERFADFRVRYGAGKETEEAKRWYGETKQVERELFPKGAL